MKIRVTLFSLVKRKFFNLYKKPATGRMGKDTPPSMFSFQMEALK